MFPLLLPQLYMLNSMLSGVECPLGQLESAVLIETPPNCLCTPSLLAGGVGWGAKKPCLYKHCSAVAKHPCAINTPSRIPPRHSPIPFAGKTKWLYPSQSKNIFLNVGHWAFLSSSLEFRMGEELEKSWVSDNILNLIYLMNYISENQPTVFKASLPHCHYAYKRCFHACDMCPNKEQNFGIFERGVICSCSITSEISILLLLKMYFIRGLLRLSVRVEKTWVVTEGSYSLHSWMLVGWGHWCDGVGLKPTEQNCNLRTFPFPFDGTSICCSW